MTPVRDVAWDPMPDAKAWWNRAAQEDARWYIATTSDPFFEMRPPRYRRTGRVLWAAAV
jgi:hypothetical protein